ncbi:MAG: hypothetical protein ACOY4M_06625 [Pseudomonadota bacterium]
MHSNHSCIKIPQYTALLLALLVPCSYAAAQDRDDRGPQSRDHDQHHPQQSAATPADREQRMREVQQHMLKMHELMHQIQDANNPEERKRLEQQQLDLMQEHMRMHGRMGDGMRGSMTDDGGMMGGGMMGGGMMNDGMMEDGMMGGGMSGQRRERE